MCAPITHTHDGDISKGNFPLHTLSENIFFENFSTSKLIPRPVNLNDERGEPFLPQNIITTHCACFFSQSHHHRESRQTMIEVADARTWIMLFCRVVKVYDTRSFSDVIISQITMMLQKLHKSAFELKGLVFQNSDDVILSRAREYHPNMLNA